MIGIIITTVETCVVGDASMRTQPIEILQK